MHLVALALLLEAADARGLPPPDPQIDIVVTAHPPHCRLRDGDPADAVDTTRKPGDPDAQVIRPDWKSGALGLFLDDYPVTGPAFWQRNGAHLDDFRFRVPADGSPLCIGSKQGYPGGYGSLRRAIDAEAYHGHVLRFTAYVATWRAGTSSSGWPLAVAPIAKAIGPRSAPILWPGTIRMRDRSRERPVAGRRSAT